MAFHAGATENRPSFWRSTLIVAILLAVTALGWSLSNHYLVPQRAGNLLEVSQDRLNLGERFAVKDLSWPVPLKNVGSAPVTVTDIRVSCGCTKVEPVFFTLQPGETQELRFTFDLTGQSSPLGSSQRFTVSFMPVLDNGLVMPDGWELRADVKPSFAAGATQLTYDGGSRLMVGESPPPARILIDEFLPGIDLQVNCPATLGAAQFVETPGAPSKRELVFFPNPSLAAGAHVGELTVESRYKGERLTEAVIPVRMYVVGIAEALPRELDLGVVSRAEETEGRVLVMSPRGEKFRVATDLWQETQLDIEVDSDAAAVSHWLTFRLLSINKGSHVLKAQIGLTDENDQTEILDIPISYRGAAAKG